MDQARPPRTKGLAPLIHKFEFLNAMSGPSLAPLPASSSLSSSSSSSSLSLVSASSAVPRFTRQRWRYSCPAVHLPHRHRPQSDDLSLGLYHPAQRLMRNSIPIEQPRTPPNLLTTSAATTPTRLMGPRLPPDMLTVSERRKLFEDPHQKYERPRTSGGEETSRAKVTMVSSFATGPARQLAPPVPIHAQFPRRRSLTPPPRQSPALTSPGDSGRARWFLRPQRFSFQPEAQTWVTPRGSPTKERSTVANLRENFELLPSGASGEYTLEPSPKKTGGAMWDASPVASAHGRHDVPGREWGDSWSAAYGGESYSLVHRSRDSSPEKSWAPRHVTAPELHDHEKDIRLAKSDTYPTMTSSMAKPRTPEIPRLLEVPHLQTTPGRASMPPPSSPPRQSIHATPPASRYRVLGSPSESSPQRVGDNSAAKGNVLTLKRLFDTPSKTDMITQSPDQDMRRRTVPENSPGCMSTYKAESPAQRRSFVSPSTSLGQDAQRASPARTPASPPAKSPRGLSSPTQNNLAHASGSPLKARIGQFESLSKFNDALGDRSAAEAMQKLKNIQSTRKSKGIRSWKRLPNLWVRSRKDDPPPNKVSSRTLPIETASPASSYPAVPLKPAQLVGSRPLIKGGSEKGIGVNKRLTPTEHRSVPSTAETAMTTEAEIGTGVESGTWWASQHLRQSQSDSGRALPSQRSVPEVDYHNEKNLAPRTTEKADIPRLDNRALAIRPQTGFVPSKTRSIRYGAANRVTWGRRQVSKRGDPVIAKAHCRLEHPKPVRVYDVNMLASLCRDRSVLRRSISRGHSSI